MNATLDHNFADATGRVLPPWLATYYRAYLSRDAKALAAVLHEDVEWCIRGPVDQFDFYGVRRGREAVIELVARIIPCYLHLTAFTFDAVLIEGEHAAVYGRLRARQRDTGRLICFRVAQNLRFRGGKLISFSVISDTFDAVEQMVGHPIDVTREMQSVPEDMFSEL